jgi:hypothetical protein
MKKKYLAIPNDQKLIWKDFLLLVKIKYYPTERIITVGEILRDLMGVTFEDIRRGELIASYEDFLAKIHN